MGREKDRESERERGKEGERECKRERAGERGEAWATSVSEPSTVLVAFRFVIPTP